MNHCERTTRDDETSIRGAREGYYVTLDLAGVAHVDRADIQTKRRGYGLDCAELADPGGYGSIAKDRSARHTRRDLFNQFQPFPGQSIFELNEARGVAARPRQAIDKASTTWISHECKHDWHGAGRPQQ